MTAPRLPDHRHLRLLSDGGGFGDVYLYRDLTLQRDVAIKVPRVGGGADEMARFESEAVRMSGLDHPHIVRIWGVRRTEDGRPCLSMEYCALGSLERLIALRPLTVAEVLAVGIGVGSALEHAHQRDLRHRDVKPANILLDANAAPRLTDFGIAASSVDVEDPDSVGVSLEWAAPEMLFHQDMGSVRSDIYSFGATLWHLLVGRSPFVTPGRDNSEAELLKRMLSLQAPPTGIPGVPVGLDHLLRATMAKEPSQRPASMRSVIASLQSVERELGLPGTHERDARLPRLLDSGIAAGSGTTGSAADAGPSHATRLAPARASSLAPPPPIPGQGGAPPTVLPPARVSARSASERVAPQGEPGVQSPTMLRPGTAQAHTTMPAGRSPGGAPGTPTAKRPRTREVELPHGPDPVAGRRRGMLLAGAVGAVAVAVSGAVLLITRDEAAPPPAPPQVVVTTGVAQDVIPPGPVTVQGRRVGADLVFSWDYSAALSSDTFRWQVVGGAPSGVTSSTKVTVPRVSAGRRTCVQVIVVRASGADASRQWSSPGCAS